MNKKELWMNAVENLLKLWKRQTERRKMQEQRIFDCG